MMSSMRFPLSIGIISVFGTVLLTKDSGLALCIVMSTIAFFSVCMAVIYNDFSPLFVSFFLINHLTGFYGMIYSRLSLIGIVLLFSPVFFFLKKPIRPFTLFLPILMGSLYYLLLIIFRPYSLNFFWITLHVEALIIFTITQLCHWSIDNIRKVLQLHILIFVIIGFAQIFFTDQTRIGGPMLSATAFGVVLVVIWSTWLTIELFSTPRKHFKIFAVSILTISTLIATGTRMTIIGTGIAVFSILFLKTVHFASGSKGKNLFRFTLATAFACLILIGTWYSLPEDLVIKQNFKSLLSGNIDESNLGRLFVWFTSFQIIQEYPIFGVGNGNFTQFIRDTYGGISFAEPFMNHPHAHNVYLIILSENGITGFIFIGIIVSVALKNLFSHLRNSTQSRPMYGLIIGSIILAVLALFDAVPYYPSVLSWGAWFFAIMMQQPNKEHLFYADAFRLGEHNG